MKKPIVGWGILNPDKELSDQTKEILAALETLPRGQVDLLLARAVSRHLNVEMRLEEGEEPTRTQMVSCTSTISNFWYDVLGKP